MKKSNLAVKIIGTIGLISFFTGFIEVTLLSCCSKGFLYILPRQYITSFIAVAIAIIIAFIIVKLRLSALGTTLYKISLNEKIDELTLKKARRSLITFPKTMTLIYITMYTLGGLFSNIAKGENALGTNLEVMTINFATSLMIAGILYFFLSYILLNAKLKLKMYNIDTWRRIDSEEA